MVIRMVVGSNSKLMITTLYDSTINPVNHIKFFNKCRLMGLIDLDFPATRQEQHPENKF